MSSDNMLDKVKKLRELTGVGFKDCKNAIDENNGDIEKSIEFLRKKGIAKASKRMGRTAAEGLVAIYENKNQFSMIEINSETDFVAKNNEFINFVEEVSQIALTASGKIDNILKSKMKNKKSVEASLVDLVAKIGEKITIRKSAFFGNDKFLNFSYTHSSIKKNIGKIGVLLSIESKKEKEIITEELKNSGKDIKIIEKIATGKLNKFIGDNTLMNQEWIMEPKKKVKDVIREFAGKDTFIVKDFLRFKVGEGL